MYILGINAASHNSSACLVRDGMLVAFVEEERFDRIKYSTAFPQRSIEYCLSEAGIAIGDVNVAAFAGVPSSEMRASAVGMLRHIHRPWYRRWLRDQVLVTGLYMGWRERRRTRGMGFSGRVAFVDHHECHASSAFHLSPFDRAAVLTVDAQGDGIASAIYLGEGTKLRRLEAYGFPEASIGHFYDCVTEYVGFKPVRDAGKTMGLSSYGDPAALGPKFERLMALEPGGRVRFDPGFMKHERGVRSCRRFAREFGPPRGKDEPATDPRFANVAAAAQGALEKAFIHLRRAREEDHGGRVPCRRGRRRPEQRGERHSPAPRDVPRRLDPARGARRRPRARGGLLRLARPRPAGRSGSRSSTPSTGRRTKTSGSGNSSRRRRCASRSWTTRRTARRGSSRRSRSSAGSRAGWKSGRGPSATARSSRIRAARR